MTPTNRILQTLERLIQDKYQATDKGITYTISETGLSLSGGKLNPFVYLFDIEPPYQSGDVRATFAVHYPIAPGADIASLARVSVDLERYRAATEALIVRAYHPDLRIAGQEVLAAATYRIPATPYSQLKRSLSEIIEAYRQ